MMKTFFAALVFYIVFCTQLLAGVPCTPLPFNLQNGQVADATQVMANYNFIISCLANAAAAGANSDITSLGGLTSPISPAQGGTSTFVASAPSTGTANNQAVTATLPTYVQTPLTAVVFIAGFTNTGPMTTPSGGLTVGSTPQLTVVRRTTDGLQPLAGGEIIAGTVTAVVYDGTRYQLVSNISPFPIGTVQDTIATVADNGFLLLNGGCASTLNFSSLWAKLGSPAQGSCGTNQWPLPDGRGKVIAMLDSGTSNQLNIVCTSTAMGTVCGAQQNTLVAGNIPTISGTTGAGSPHAHSAFVNDPGHAHGISPAAVTVGGAGSGFGATGTTGTNSITQSQTTGVHVNSASGGAGTNDLTATESAHTHSVSLGAASPTSFNTVQPTLMLNRQIKY